MEPLGPDFISVALGGELIAGEMTQPVRRVITDSRHTQAGDMFFALPGERFDGHDFLHDVAAKGAVGVVIDRTRRSAALPDCAVVSVDNTRAALGRLGAAYRKKFSLPVVAVGGSNGKTTTKGLVARVLEQKLHTVASEASFNNDIGVPMTLLRLERKHQAAVLEVGTNHPGELAPLVELIQPRYGLITNIGREHLEFFGDLEGVAREEGMLAELLPADGRLFLNGDNEWSERIAARTRANVVKVGLADANDWRAGNLKLGAHGMQFQVHAPVAEFCGEYTIHLLGQHQVVNALFAIALGAELGLNRDDIQRGLAACEPAKMRLQLWETGGVRVLDDAYNANADSMLAALSVLRELPCKGRRVAVLGDMAELGVHSESAHAEVGRSAAQMDVVQLFAVGKMAQVMAQAARAAGLNRVLEFGDVDAAGAALKTFLKPGDLVLLKASRATQLERVAWALRGGNGTH